MGNAAIATTPAHSVTDQGAWDSKMLLQLDTQ
jgi:hypothetical protein